MLHKDARWRFIVTGPESRIPRDVDPEPSVEKLKARGLWDLDGIDPRVQQLLELVIQERMDDFPLHSDEHMPVVAADLSPLQKDNGEQPVATTNYLESDMGTYGTLQAAVAMRFCPTQYRSEALPRLLNDGVNAMLEGFHPPGPSPLLADLRHEAFHPVVCALLSLPGFVGWLEAELSAVDGQGAFSFHDVAARQRIATHLSGYAAQVNAPDAGACKVLEEMGCEALAAARQLQEDAPPMARVWWEATRALLGRGSPVAATLNQELRDLHRRMWFEHRSAPDDETDWIDLLPEGAQEILDSDPDLAWEREHPEDIDDETYRRWEAVEQRARSGEIAEMVRGTLVQVSERLRAMALPQHVASALPDDPAELVKRWSGGEHVMLMKGWPLGAADRDPLLQEAMRLEAEVVGVAPNEVDAALRLHREAKRRLREPRSARQHGARRRTTVPVDPFAPPSTSAPGPGSGPRAIGGREELAATRGADGSEAEGRRSPDRLRPRRPHDRPF